MTVLCRTRSRTATELVVLCALAYRWAAFAPGTAAVQPVSVDPRAVRVRHALDAHRVEVPAQQEGAASTASTRAHEDARAAGRLLQALGLEARRARPCLDEVGGLTLARSSRDERGIHRVDCDQRRQERRQ